MTKTHLSFFATKTDLASLLRSVESEGPLQFVLTGLFDSPNIEVRSHFPDDPNPPGIGAVHNANHETCYLIGKQELFFEARSVPQSSGDVKYALDQLENPKTIVFRPGGMCSEECLIAGQVGTTTSDPISLELFQLFSKRIRNQFVKIKAFYVGKEAADLFDKGYRLTANSKAPTLYDLKRD